MDSATGSALKSPEPPSKRMKTDEGSDDVRKDGSVAVDDAESEEKVCEDCGGTECPLPCAVCSDEPFACVDNTVYCTGCGELVCTYAGCVQIYCACGDHYCRKCCDDVGLEHCSQCPEAECGECGEAGCHGRCEEES
eukprot:m.138947 g.138947  ORF g.138947 m.138947 type:complete len:137 (+) comp14786_c1_seq2:122-532(+)